MGLQSRARAACTTLAAIADAAAAGKIECLVLLGCDPLADFPDTDLARRMMAGAPRIIAIDTFLTKSSSPADVVLAAAAYGEKSGTHDQHRRPGHDPVARRSRRAAPAVPTG